MKDNMAESRRKGTHIRGVKITLFVVLSSLIVGLFYMGYALGVHDERERQEQSQAFTNEQWRLINHRVNVKKFVYQIEYEACRDFTVPPLLPGIPR